MIIDKKQHFFKMYISISHMLISDVVKLQLTFKHFESILSLNGLTRSTGGFCLFQRLIDDLAVESPPLFHLIVDS